MPTNLSAPMEMLASAARLSGGRVGLAHIVIVAVSAAALWGGLILVDRIRTHSATRRQSPQGLFWELCSAHRLSRAERNALWSAAETLPEADCCRIFVDAEILAGLSASGSADAGEFSRLARKLFGAKA